jgi:hypothetical protein
MLTQHKTLDELADALATALGKLDSAGQRLAIALYRLLAADRPVAAADSRVLGGLDDHVRAGAAGGQRGAAQGEQVRLRPGRGEDDLCGPGADEGGGLGARLSECPAGASA